MESNKFSEKQLKDAFKNSVIKFNRTLLYARTDEEKIIMNKLLLGFISDVLKELGVDYHVG